ncbi:MAG: ATP-binding protein [Methylotenera sp.]|nr:ATP-binding protein [Methylotenera sp.]
MADNTLFQNLTAQSELSLQARTIRIINVFRFILSLIFVLFSLYTGQENWGDNQAASLFFSLSLAYSLFSLTLLIVAPLKSSALVFFNPVQIIIDIFFIILIMHALGGIQSGLGLLLIITIVTASLVSNGQLALFYAAIATIGLLLEQSYQIAKWDLPISVYSQPAMLSLSCFATAWLGYSFAKRIMQSEALASARGVDLENLAQVNALITEEMQDGVIVIDQSLNIRHYNSQAMSLLALTKNNSDESFQLSDDVTEIGQLFTRWMHAEGIHENLIISINNKELKLRFEPINQENRIHGAVVFIQDWSLMQSAAQQSKLAALGRLTANIAHEIRNPLSAISHANQLLQEEDFSSQNKRMLEIVADNIQRIDQIIKDVLELNRRDRTNQEKLPLNQFILDFYTQFCAVEKIPPSHFQMTSFKDSLFATYDQRHLMQILWNLCKNGWEHSHKQMGSLKLNCTKNGRAGLNLEVIDDGEGVAEENRNKLFEPFYTTKTTGNGLGLYISRELAEANGSRLSYQKLDSGSAFILQLQTIN